MVFQIVKYPNRKLYMPNERRKDVPGGCYITLSEVAAMVRNGDRISVTEYGTDRDLTADTLAQALAAGIRNGSIHLPVVDLRVDLGAPVRARN